jgi:hypothetical protein
MRRLSFAAVVIAMCGSLCSAGDGPNVPAAVERALAAKFGITDTPNWVVYKEDGKKIYATRWRDKDGILHEADFDSSGNVVKTSKSLKTSDLPKAVSDAVEKKLPGSSTKEAKLEEGKVTEYELRVTDSASKLKLVVVSPDGSNVMVYDF